MGCESDCSSSGRYGGLIPGLAQWVKESGIAVAVVYIAAVAWIQSLA